VFKCDEGECIIYTSYSSEFPNKNNYDNVFTNEKNFIFASSFKGKRLYISLYCIWDCTCNIQIRFVDSSNIYLIFNSNRNCSKRRTYLKLKRAEGKADISENLRRNIWNGWQ
jgi:hypothetical protein